MTNTSKKHSGTTTGETTGQVTTKSGKGNSHGIISEATVYFTGISGLIIAHPLGFGAPLLTVVMSFALLIIGIEITAMGVVGRLIVGKIPNRKKSLSKGYTLP